MQRIRAADRERGNTEERADSLVSKIDEYEGVVR